MSAPLYELVTQHRQLQQLAEDGDVDPQALIDTLEGLTGEIELKAQSVAAVIRNLEAEAEAVTAAAKAMTARAKRVQERAEGIRTYLLTNMQATGITRISCPWFVISLRKNPPRVDVSDEASIPDKFRVWPEVPAPMLDRRALLEALKAGDDVPGAALGQSERVEIRP